MGKTKQLFRSTAVGMHRYLNPVQKKAMGPEPRERYELLEPNYLNEIRHRLLTQAASLAKSIHNRHKGTRQLHSSRAALAQTQVNSQPTLRRKCRGSHRPLACRRGARRSHVHTARLDVPKRWCLCLLPRLWVRTSG